MSPARSCFFLFLLGLSMEVSAQADTMRVDTTVFIANPTRTASSLADTVRTDTTGLVVKTTPAKEAAPVDTAVQLDWKARHQPSRAAIYSAILPGAGQVYNRKYWKVPIVLGGLGVCYYFIHDNTQQFNRYKDAYLAMVDNDPNTVDEFNGAYSADALRNVADTYHRWRDLSYLAIGLVYMMNIVDASVDAHFVRFNVSRDLTMDLRPSIPLAAQGALGLSLSVRL